MALFDKLNQVAKNLGDKTSSVQIVEQVYQQVQDSVIVVGIKSKDKKIIFK